MSSHDPSITVFALLGAYNMLLADVVLTKVMNSYANHHFLAKNGYLHACFNICSVSRFIKTWKFEPSNRHSVKSFSSGCQYKNLSCDMHGIFRWQ